MQFLQYFSYWRWMARVLARGILIGVKNVIEGGRNGNKDKKIL